jgi:hypothetical protein
LTLRPSPTCFAPLAFALACACGDPEPRDVNKPAPPDMAALLAVYDAPDGVLTAETAAEALEAASAIRDTIVALGVDETLIDTVLEAVAAKESSATESTSAGSLGTSRQALTEGEGYLLATRICNGWGAEPAPDPAHGAIRLTVPFTEAGLDPVIWGEVESCQYLIDGSQVLLHGLEDTPAGAVRVSFGAPVAFDGIARARALFDFDLAGDLDGMRLSADFDFRVDAERESFEVRIPTSSGAVIAVLSADAFTGVRAANGDFGCNPEARTCTSGSETITF